ncbi:unnamed protein product [Lathyrus sativus]|nr:unnamed protein product [Lathyrus sativus]
MKGKTPKPTKVRGRKKLSNGRNTLQLHFSKFSLNQYKPLPTTACPSTAFSRLRSMIEAEANDSPTICVRDTDEAAETDSRDCILSQDLFCSPDYLTPENQRIFNCLTFNKDNSPCPKSPEKLTTRNKRCRLDDVYGKSLSPTIFNDHQQDVELDKDSVAEEVSLADEVSLDKLMVAGKPNPQNYVSHSAAALRCRAMPPPCYRNPYLKDVAQKEIDPFANQRSKCAGFFPKFTANEGLSRYHTDFEELEQIGRGNFSCVFKVLKRIDGCLYAVKRSTRQLHLETERKKALMEVQALAALGSHENIVGYYSSWFESEQLYIQMDICDHSLSKFKGSELLSEGQLLEVLYQVANALRFIHEKGIVHLDVKPDNIYVKNGIYKLGDFGCATLIDNSLPIEEGDARYMPQEILNEKYDHLDKVDIFSLGASIYELVRKSPLPESRCHFSNLKEGKLSLLPSNTMQFQNLLKAMIDRDPVKRPSARELVENPIFDRVLKTGKN